MQSRRVLLVDSDADSRTIFRLSLEHHGFSVVEAEDGDAALEILLVTPPAALVTELTLGRMDGFRLLEAIRREPAMAEVRVVVVTARVFESDRRRAEAAGCNLFLPKPLPPTVLAQELERLIGR
jgi:two-component system, cell cycle response regulator DivK